MKNPEQVKLPSDVKKCTCNPEAHSKAEVDCCGGKTTKDHATKVSSCCGGGQ